MKTLLADIIAFRDECRTAQRDLIPAADPTGDARMAYGTCADLLTALIARYQVGEKTPNQSINPTPRVRVSVNSDRVARSGLCLTLDQKNKTTGE